MSKNREYWVVSELIRKHQKECLKTTCECKSEKKLFMVRNDSAFGNLDGYLEQTVHEVLLVFRELIHEYIGHRCRN